MSSNDQSKLPSNWHFSCNEPSLNRLFLFPLQYYNFSFYQYNLQPVLHQRQLWNILSAVLLPELHPRRVFTTLLNSSPLVWVPFTSILTVISISWKYLTNTPVKYEFSLLDYDKNYFQSLRAIRCVFMVNRTTADQIYSLLVDCCSRNSTT